MPAYVCREGRCGPTWTEHLCGVTRAFGSMVDGHCVGATEMPRAIIDTTPVLFVEIQRQDVALPGAPPGPREAYKWTMPWTERLTPGTVNARGERSGVDSEPVTWSDLGDRPVRIVASRAITELSVVCGVSPAAGLAARVVLPTASLRSFDAALGPGLDTKTWTVRLPSRDEFVYRAVLTVALPARTPVTITDERSVDGSKLAVVGDCGPLTLDLKGRWADVDVYGWSSPLSVKAPRSPVFAWFWPGADVSKGVRMETDKLWLVAVPVGAPLALGSDRALASTATPGIGPVPGHANGGLRVYEWAEVDTPPKDLAAANTLTRWDRVRVHTTAEGIDPWGSAQATPDRPP